jgi:hypothetical protein
MKNFEKYLNQALKRQFSNELPVFNNEYNIAKLGTTREVFELVQKARHDKFGYLDKHSKLSKADFLEWHRVYLIQNMRGES